MTNDIRMALEIAAQAKEKEQLDEITENTETDLSRTEQILSNDELHAAIEEAVKKRNTATNNINKAKDMAKKLQTEIKVMKEFDQNTEEVENRLTNTVGQISHFKEEAEKLQQTIENLNFELRRHHAETQQSQEASTGEEMAKVIKLPFTPEDNPRLYATVVGNMASAIQNNLIWGEDYLLRLKLKRDRPLHNTANGDHGSVFQEEDENLANQIEAIEQERSFMRSMMFALKRHYDEAYSHRDRGVTNFPRFLFRSNTEVKKKAEEYAARRQQEWLEQQRKLKSEGKQFYSQMDDLTMPNF